MAIELYQGGTAIADPGDEVWNMGTTSCALVLAFYPRVGKVACYHWPGFGANDTYLQTFRGMLAASGPPIGITVITNQQPPGVHNAYMQTFELLYKSYDRQVPIHYYTNNDDKYGMNTLVGVLGNTDIDLERTNARPMLYGQYKLSLLMHFESGEDYWP